jgi:acyl dehydratase
MTDAGAQALRAAQAMIGRPLPPSRWFALDQPRITAFGEITEDRQFVHLEPARAAAETPFGGTVAHGFLTLAMLSAMAYDAQPAIPGAGLSVNYGFDRLRFVAPVPAGARVRGRFALADAQPAGDGALTLTWDATVEIEGGDRPAIVARWLTRHYLQAANAPA